MSKKITAWSYSRWTDYEKCPQLAKFKHVDRIQEPENEAMKRGLMTHQQLTQYVGSSLHNVAVPESATKFRELMEQLRVLEPMLEQQWGYDAQWKPAAWFGSATWFRSVLDVAIIYDDHTADVVDYKTGKPSETHVQQAELYAISIVRRYPQIVNVTVRYWYLDHGTESVFRFSKNDVPELMEKWTKRVQPMLSDTIFAPRPGKHCAYCAFAKSKDGPCRFG